MRVLLVSGEPSQQWSKAASRLEAESGLELSVVSSSDAAVDFASLHPCDLVVSDLVLPRPGLPGASTLNRVREFCPDVTTVLVTDQASMSTLLSTAVDHVLHVDDGSGTVLGEALLDVIAAERDNHDERPVPQGPPGSSKTLVERPARASAALAVKELRSGGSAESDNPKIVAGKYEVISELGRGGMAVVYRARDTFIHRQVAVKMCDMGVGIDERVQQRMRREVKISGGLDHPNIVTVYDAGIDAGQIYLIMELVDGQTLKQCIREKGAWPVSDAISFGIQILEALEHAHARGVVHRDLKPANVLMTGDGRAKVADFGVAKMLSLAASEEDGPIGQTLDTRLTAEGTVIGTPAYMAPEQMFGEAVDHRADLYALGAILYELLTGKMLAMVVRPVVQAMLPSDQDRVAAALSELPGGRRLARVLETALAGDPSERQKSARELAEQLKAAAGSRWSQLMRWPLRR